MEINAANQIPQISISHLSKSFLTSGELFQNLSLNIFTEEFISLLGPSGCGKSTILRIISGLEEFNSGSLENKLQSSQAMVFQDPALIPWRTALENVLLPFELEKGKNKNHRSETKEKAFEALSLVGLKKAANLLPKELSGGMRMRVSIARAITNQPKLLLLDEPFAALDENTRERLQEDLLLIQRKFKMTVVFVTHSIAEAVFLSERILILSQSPTRILFDDEIRLPKNRDANLRSAAEFFYELKRVRSHFPMSEVER